MEKQVGKNFVWVLKNANFVSVTNSDQFLVAGCKWQLHAYYNGNILEFYYKYNGVADSQSLPCKWRRHVKLRLTIVNRLNEKLSIVTDSELFFDEKSPISSYPTVLPPSNLLARNGGFLVNGELKIVVEVVAHEVIGTLGELEDSKLLSRIEASRGAKSNGLLKKTRQMSKTVDVNGFQVLPSQVESVKRIFEKYPDFATEFCSKNRHLKSTYMNALLGLIETLCRLPQELSDDDLEEASDAVSFVADGGFKVDWLEKMLKEVKAKKKRIDSSEEQMRQMEEELHKYNQKCVELKLLMEMAKEDFSAASVPLSFDDTI